MATIAWPLLLAIIIVFPLLLFASFYLLWIYIHPDDKNITQHILAKIVVVLGLTFAAVNVLLIPLDVGNRNSGSTLDVSLLMYIVFIIVISLILGVIPFVYCFYEAEEAEGNKIKKQIKQAVIYELLLWAILAIFIGIMYSYLGKANLPVNSLTSQFFVYTTVPDTPCPACSSTRSTFDVTVSLLIYIVATAAWVGLFLFVVFAGIGMAALPLDLINDFRRRPKLISAADFNRIKVETGHRAARLLEMGRDLHRKELERGYKRNWSMRTDYSRFKRNVYLLEKDWKIAKEAHEGRRHWIFYWLWLFVGIICLFLSILWLLHMLLFMIVSPPLHGFLNTFFTELDKVFPLFGTGFYCLFVYYLLFATMKGNFKMGLRIVICTVHPMEVGGTLLNSFMFNVMLVLLTSIYVTQFCTNAFSTYTRLTSVGSWFGVQMQYLMFYKYFFRYSVFGLFCISLLAFVPLVICPRDRYAKSPNYDDDDL